MESSLQRISSNFLLWKRNDSSVVLQPSSWRGNHAASRSSRTAKSRRRALGNYFSKRICNMFPISKCRGDRDLGLCTTSEPERNDTIRFCLRRSTFFSGSHHCASVALSCCPRRTASLGWACLSNHPLFLQKFGLSRLNPIFSNGTHVPQHLCHAFFFTFGLSRLNPHFGLLGLAWTENVWFCLTNSPRDSDMEEPHMWSLRIDLLCWLHGSTWQNGLIICLNHVHAVRVWSEEKERQGDNCNPLAPISIWHNGPPDISRIGCTMWSIDSVKFSHHNCSFWNIHLILCHSHDLHPRNPQFVQLQLLTVSHLQIDSPTLGSPNELTPWIFQSAKLILLSSSNCLFDTPRVSHDSELMQRSIL